jgi:hypothetical protein
MRNNILFDLGINPSEVIGDWTCPACQQVSKYIGYCDFCEKKKQANDLLLSTKKLYLAQIDKEFNDLFGINFSINDFDDNTNARKKIKTGVAKYIGYIKDMYFNNGKGIVFAGN